GAWVHNDCDPAEDALRKALELPPYAPIGPKPGYNALKFISDGKHRWGPLPKPPPGAPVETVAHLEDLKKQVDDAEKRMKDAEEAYRNWEIPKMREAMAKAPPNSGGFSSPLDDESKRLSEVNSKATVDVHDAIVRYVTVVDAARDG